MMRRIVILGAGCALAFCTAPAHAAPEPHSDTLALASATAPADTTVRKRFRIPSLPLEAALREYSDQAAVGVELDVAAAGVRSRAVAGTYTAAEALRALLAGTGMTIRFRDADRVLVQPEVGAGRGVLTLAPLVVVAHGGRGYAAPRSTSATKTDTPLRDTPQSVSVVTQEVIADQAMQGMADVVRYVPGVTMGQGEGHRDAPTIRGNASTANFFVDGVRDDAQYLRDLYNAERVEVLKGANAMIFGRGSGGGVINRVTKEADWSPTLAFTAEGGSFDHRRATMDAGEALGPAAARVNAVYEKSGSFREEFELQRYGVNPTVALALGTGTTVRAGYEYFNDRRTVDRGIPSYQGRPSAAPITTFFGNPAANRATAGVHQASASVEHLAASGLVIRNRTQWASYDKFYQNSYPGAVNAAGTQVTLSAYNHAIDRRNLFNQTDVVGKVSTGRVGHTLLLGAEVGRQETGQQRNTGYYDGTTTSVSVPFDRPTVATPIAFRQSATDADNRTVATVAGAYVQDQLTLSPHLQAIVGLRFDRFAVDFHDNRRGGALSRTDDLVSPRAGLVVKPVEAASVYGSYGVSYLPSSGDQFASLTATTQTLEPERFTNREVGAKWDVHPGLALTAALYQLDRTNTSAPDPADPSRIVQTGSQRTTGVELSGSGQVTESWQLLASVAQQRARIVSATSAAQAGARVPLVPRRTLSVWNRYQILRSVGVGLGVIRQDEMFAAIDNTVTLPGFTRADAALFVRLGTAASVQVNVENLTDARYYPTSHGNNNIMPGASRTLRLSVTARP